MMTMLRLLGGPVAAALVALTGVPANAITDDRGGETRLVVLHDNSGNQNLRLYFRPDTSALHKLTTAARREAVIRAITAHLDPAAEVRVATFGDRFLISRAWQRRPAELLQAFNSIMQEGGPSPIWDAIYDTVNVFEGFPGRRAVILISDGLASANRRSFEEALQHAMRTRVRIHVAALEARSNRELVKKARPGDPTERLRVLARATGGEYIEPELVDLAAACGRLAEALSTAAH